MKQKSQILKQNSKKYLKYKTHNQGKLLLAPKVLSSSESSPAYLTSKTPQHLPISSSTAKSPFYNEWEMPPLSTLILL